MSPQPWQAHTAGIDINEAKGMPAPVMPKMPRGYQAQYVLLDKKSGEPLANHPYKLKLPTGKTVAGIDTVKGICVIGMLVAGVMIAVSLAPALAAALVALVGIFGIAATA